MKEQTLFTPEETGFVIQLFNKWQITPMAPDAVGVCERVQSIAAKMQALTEQPKEKEDGK